MTQEQIEQQFEKEYPGGTIIDFKIDGEIDETLCLRPPTSAEMETINKWIIAKKAIATAKAWLKPCCVYGEVDKVLESGRASTQAFMLVNEVLGQGTATIRKRKSAS